MNLPAYEVEPGHPGDLTDIIRTPGSDMPRAERLMRFISSYQGQVDYRALDGDGRLTWRYAKVPYRWGWLKEGERTHWNYATEEEFQFSVNGAWGILHGFCSNPVGPATLAIFRQEVCALAVTGYFDHEQGKWVICDPTTSELSTQSWERKTAQARAAQAILEATLPII